MHKLKLEKKVQSKWFNNLMVFLAPLGILYLTTIVGVVSQDHHEFVVRDLIPNAYARGGIVLWVLNSGLDYFRKLKAQ